MPHPHNGVGRGGYGRGGTLTVHIGDLHIGSSVALCPPVVRLDDGGTHYASEDQLWFWKCWCEFWRDTAELKESLGCRVLAVFGGDLRDGDHHRTTQLWAVNEHDQGIAVIEALRITEPVIDGAVFVRGTGAHSGPASIAEEDYARFLATKGWRIWKNKERYSFWTWTAVIEGVRIQVKHSPGTMSWVPHTRDGAASRQAQYTWEEYMKSGEPPPDMAVFHHVHVRGRGFYEDTECAFVPSWQMPTNWVTGKQHSPRIEPPGGLRLHCINGTHTPYWLRFKPKGGASWTKS